MEKIREKLSQSQLVMRYLRENGQIVPARHVGSRTSGGFFGSEITRRCREMRKQGLLHSERWAENPKFVVFYPTKNLTKLWK